MTDLILNLLPAGTSIPTALLLALALLVAVAVVVLVGVALTRLIGATSAHVTSRRRPRHPSLPATIRGAQG
jgi:hypothetical protein